jgi:hypothetical protein
MFIGINSYVSSQLRRSEMLSVSALDRYFAPTELIIEGGWVTINIQLLTELKIVNRCTTKTSNQRSPARSVNRF